MVVFIIDVLVCALETSNCNVNLTLTNRASGESDTRITKQQDNCKWQPTKNVPETFHIGKPTVFFPQNPNLGIASNTCDVSDWLR